MPAVLAAIFRARKSKHFAALIVRSPVGASYKLILKFLNLLIQFYLNNVTNLHQLTSESRTLPYSIRVRRLGLL